MSEDMEPWDPFNLQDLFWLHDGDSQQHNASVFAVSSADYPDAMCLDPTTLAMNKGEQFLCNLPTISSEEHIIDIAASAPDHTSLPLEAALELQDRRTDSQSRDATEYHDHEHARHSDLEHDSDFSWRTHDIEDKWYYALQSELLAFREDKNRVSLLTDALLPRQRRKIHAMCHMMRLSHMSHGDQRRKRILVSKCCLGGIRSDKFIGRTWNPKSNQWLEGTIDPTIVVLDGKDLPPQVIRDCLARTGVALPSAIGALQYPRQPSLWRAFMAFEDVETAAACLLTLRNRPNLAKDLDIYGHDFYRFAKKVPALLVMLPKTEVMSAVDSNVLAFNQLSDDSVFTESGVMETQSGTPDMITTDPQLPEDKAAPVVGTFELDTDTCAPWGPPKKLWSLPKGFLSVPTGSRRYSSDDTGGFDTDGTGGTGFSYMSIGQTPRAYGTRDTQGYGSSSDPDYGSNLSISKKRKRTHNITAYGKAVEREFLENPFGRECTFEFCGKKFERECDARKHEKVHYGPRPFKCEKCEKAFMWNKDLVRHEKVHERAELKAHAKAAKASKKANTEKSTGATVTPQDFTLSNRSRAFGRMAGKFKNLLS